MITTSPKRISKGFTPIKGDLVVLSRGTGDGRRELSYFTADGNWTCPATVNGFWYGAVTKSELEADVRRFV